MNCSTTLSGSPSRPGRRRRAALPHRHPSGDPDTPVKPRPAFPDQHTGQPRGHRGTAQLRLAECHRRAGAYRLPDRPPRLYCPPDGRAAPSGTLPRRRKGPPTVGHRTPALAVRHQGTGRRSRSLIRQRPLPPATLVRPDLSPPLPGACRLLRYLTMHPGPLPTGNATTDRPESPLLHPSAALALTLMTNTDGKLEPDTTPSCPASESDVAVPLPPSGTRQWVCSYLYNYLTIQL